MSQTKITVITVCLNASATLERAILSVRAQTHPLVEHIIMDGGSTDGTLAIIDRHHSAISRVISEPDNGIYDAMNKAVTLASGDVIYFLNADDAFYDDHVLEDVARFFEEDPARTLVHGKVLLEQGREKGEEYSKGAQFRSIDDFLNYTICHQSVFAKRDRFLRLGGFDLQYHFAADFDWLLRAYRLDPSGFVYFDRVMARYFYQGRSFQQKRKTVNEGARIIHHYFPWHVSARHWVRYVLIRGLKKRILGEAW